MATDTPPAETAPLVIHGIADLRARVGQTLGVSDWLPVEQETVTAFAVLTGDEQWIHVDPERASSGPFGAPVQHGFLTLSLSTGLLDRVFQVDDVSLVLNYGLNKVRFPAPLRVGSHVRMHVELLEASDLAAGVQVVYRLTYEVENEAKPCCVAELVFRYHP